MSKEQGEAIESGTLIGVVRAEFETDIPEIVIDPREMALASIRRICAEKYPSNSREREVAALVRGYKPRIVELIRRRNNEALETLLYEMEGKARPLALPERVPGVIEQTQNLRFRNTFREMSWTSAEIDALPLLMGASPMGLDVPGPISDITISSVKIDGRLVTRDEVRKRIEKPNALHAEKQQKEAEELAAENAERSKRGEPLRHRNW